MIRLFKIDIIRALMFLVITLAFAISSQGKSIKKPTQPDMRAINLVGMQIFEFVDSSGLDSFGYQLKLKEDIEDVSELLAEEIGDEQKIISRIFELNEDSSFKNIFVFITVGTAKEHNSKYVLNIIYQNKSGSLFNIDYDIVNIANNHLEIENGPSDEKTKYRLETGKKLFDNGPF